MSWSDDGHLTATPGSPTTDPTVCPFHPDAPTEAERAQDLYADLPHHHTVLGFYSSLYLGRIPQVEVAKKRTSGGLLTYVLQALKNRGEIASVIHAKATYRKPLFVYGMSDTEEEILQAPTSAYYPVSFDQVLNQVRETPGDYAFVGVPCYIKALRQLQRIYPELARIKYTLAMFCGHMKTAGYAEYLAWQCGVHPKELTHVNFRQKIPGNDALNYGFSANGAPPKPTRSMRGTNWGSGYFKYKACDACDDVVGELADASFGDAWLPQYSKDNGTSVVIVRHPVIDQILGNPELRLTRTNAHTVCASQAGGIRHKRALIQDRLTLMGLTLSKRTQPSPVDSMDINRKRIENRERSHQVWQEAREKDDVSLMDTFCNQR